VLLAVFVDHLLRVRGAALGWGIAALAASLVLLLPTTDYIAAPHLDPAFFQPGGDAQRIPAGAGVLLVPFADDPVTAEWEDWQVVAGLRFRVPSGYFLGRDPNSDRSHLTGPPLRPLSRALVQIVMGQGAPALSDPLLAQMRDDLRYWRTQVVVLGPSPHDDQALALLTAVLGRAPVQDQGVSVWWDATPQAVPDSQEAR
jgi:hypothetical protein